ncbi:hypothetical protein AB0L59_00215 [Streptomyces sp. NPDC052109]|uniref:hypothetical protein n=1 Tax=Streptomyces sp. NPDC052109 TaxID=3155527 RepID=UPI0034149759
MTDYGRANIPQRVGDGLAGHEIIQHAYLKALGLEKSRGSYNAAILLTEEQHRKVDAYQRERGLYDSEKLAKMSLEDIVHENAECLRLAGLRQSAIDRVTEYAFEQFPALQARGVKIWSD